MISEKMKKENKYTHRQNKTTEKKTEICKQRYVQRN